MNSTHMSKGKLVKIVILYKHAFCENLPEVELFAPPIESSNINTLI